VCSAAVRPIRRGIPQTPPAGNASNRMPISATEDAGSRIGAFEARMAVATFVFSTCRCARLFARLHFPGWNYGDRGLDAG